MKLSFALMSLALWATSLVQPPCANASTVAVGNCRPSLTSYHSISAAVAAVPPGSTVFVCPGTYPEQITITTSLTLRGVLPIGAVITAPDSGLVASNGTAAQVLVQGMAVSTP